MIKIQRFTNQQAAHSVLYVHTSSRR